MTENLIKRYLLESAYENGTYDSSVNFREISFQNDLFEKINSGKIELKENEFKKWLEEYKRLRELFGEFLINNGYLLPDEKVIELSEDESISSIKNLKVNKKIIVAQAGEGCFAKPFNGSLEGHLIVDGIYDNQLIYLARNASISNFTIGYCGNKDSLYTKRVIEYYRKLKRVLKLIINIDNVDIKEKTMNRDKIMILDYRK